MTTFDKREEGFEKQFAHDEELRFKATARRNKLLGLWAAEKLGLEGADAQAYAKDVVLVIWGNPEEMECFERFARTSMPKACSNRTIRYDAPWTR